MLKGHDRYPGAGTYAIPSKITEGPKVHMHAKTDSVDQNVKRAVPGPGQYDLQNSPNTRHNRGPAYSLGSGSRYDLSQRKTHSYKPGPGNYDQQADMRRTAPKFSFGKDTRPEMARNKHQQSPGPGNYEAKEVIGHDGP